MKKCVQVRKYLNCRSFNSKFIRYLVSSTTQFFYTPFIPFSPSRALPPSPHLPYLNGGRKVTVLSLIFFFSLHFVLSLSLKLNLYQSWWFHRRSSRFAFRLSLSALWCPVPFVRLDLSINSYFCLSVFLSVCLSYCLSVFLSVFRYTYNVSALVFFYIDYWH